MHTGNHCGSSIFPKLNDVLGRIINWIGGNQLVWKYEHQISHHLSPNILHKDNDCEIGYPFIRLHPQLPWKWYHLFQPVILLFGISVGLLKWSISDPINIYYRKVGNISLPTLSKRDWIELIGTKIFWWGVHFIVPCITWGTRQGVLSGVLKFGIASWYLENIFIVNHIQEPLMEKKREDSSKDREHWAIQQIKGTSNWSAGSGWWNWLSGGLNHQIEHHLFPSIHPYLYPKISKVVKNTCQEFKLPYHNYSHFGSAWLDMFRLPRLFKFEFKHLYIKYIEIMDNSQNTLTKPRRGRPPKYSPEERKHNYQLKNKQAQIAHYALHKEEKTEKTKHQAKLYRFAYQILKDLWNDHLIPTTKYNSSIQALMEQKQVVDY
jgi:linoleoyl-CoA desaturase